MSTRPWGRMLLVVALASEPGALLWVSMSTRPWGRMLPESWGYDLVQAIRGSFNEHPPLGANATGEYYEAPSGPDYMFQ